MLCRVIMGNVEVVLPGSKQFQPSNESFDNGVDDLQNPQNYIIWDANVHKHIYAEYAVIVKVPPVTNGTNLDPSPPPHTHTHHHFPSVLLFGQENLFGTIAECLVLKDSVPNISEIISTGSPDNLTKVCFLGFSLCGCL